MDRTILQLLQNELQVTRSSKKNGAAEMCAQTLRKSMVQFVQDSATMRKFFEGQCKRLYDEDVDEDQEMGMLLRRLLEGQLMAFEALAENLPGAAASGQIVGREDFLRAGDSIRSMLDEMSRAWPIFDQVKAQSAKEAIEQGEYYSVKEALDELRLADSQAFQSGNS